MNTATTKSVDSSKTLLMKEPIHVALAILYCQDRFLMQLRDQIPGIVYPGHWGLFGGHLDPGETPAQAVQRELVEEICYTPPALSEFGCYADSRLVRHVFAAPLTVDISHLVLQEGWDLKLFDIEQIRQGQAYSSKANRFCPLVPAAQQILVDFQQKQLIP